MARKPQRPPQKRRRRKPPLLQRFRVNFLTGLVVVAPVVLTIYLIWLFVGFVDDRVLPWLPQRYNPVTYFGEIPGLGVIVFIAGTTVAGYLAKGLLGRQMLRFGETLVDRTPIVRSIYNAVKQIIETIFAQSKSSFQNACLIEYPRKGIWAVAFVSTDARGELPSKTGVADMLSVFLPTTPNPTSGFLLFLPREDVVIMDMSVEDAAKLVISAGLVVPPTAEEIKAGRKPIPKASKG